MEELYVSVKLGMTESIGHADREEFISPDEVKNEAPNVYDTVISPLKSVSSSCLTSFGSSNCPNKNIILVTADS